MLVVCRRRSLDAAEAREPVETVDEGLDAGAGSIEVELCVSEDEVDLDVVDCG